MQFFSISTCLCIIGLCISLSTQMTPTCRGMAIHMTPEEMDGLMTCMSEMAPDVTVQEDAAKMGAAVPKNEMACLGKCIMSKEGLLDDKGMPSKDLMMAKINASMPDSVIVEMDTAAAKCVDNHGKIVNPNDATCQSYHELTQCMTIALIELCKKP
ncbi:uncharacterized protein LOC110847103 [Folsomia candida]|uniref:Uncharacterized protein n=1 Tax=Folsomia candida TaxID=158441 RepID=A0A226EI73_FOLCA|nr:uncharacterized protein LOC110847103 [Folsomia candida]OXA57040.1 hypothetical protein Fcan01_06534 [Folsomia candida]